jgi:hypothetical protein
MSLEQLTLSDEQVQDIVASLISSGNNSDAVYDDTNDTLTVSLSDSISVNTLEADDGVFNDSITDPAGNTHTGELADIDDLSSGPTEVVSGSLSCGEFDHHWWAVKIDELNINRDGNPLATILENTSDEHFVTLNQDTTTLYYTVYKI